MQLLFAACFILAGVLSASASAHGGMAGPAASAIHESAGVDAQDHNGHQANVSGQAKLDCHGEDAQGKQDHKGSCCDAACFMAMDLKHSPWGHVRPRNSFASCIHVRFAGFERLLLERPPKQ
ncbi:MAG: hypothetical protein H6879_06515 [Rhodobiaceae bacterium]|nr:hypothetical protein [Rhodobiaceae bacterium]